MKNILAILVAVLFLTEAHAQERCTSGIYMKVGLQPSFFSVNINGDTGLVVSLSYLSGTLALNYTGYGTTRSSQVGVWSYLMGTWDGSAYQLSGDVVQGACREASHSTCDKAGNATYNLDSLTQTTQGAAWDFNCQQAYKDAVSSGQNVVKLTKIF